MNNSSTTEDNTAIKILKTTGEVLLYVAGFVVLSILNSFIFQSLFPEYYSTNDFSTISNPWFEGMAQYLPSAIFSVVLAIGIYAKLFKRNIKYLGFAFIDYVKDFNIGMLYAFMAVTMGFVLLVIGNQIQIAGIDFNGKLLFGFIFLFIFQTFYEEVAFRSFLIPTIEVRHSTLAALIVSTILFMLVHLGNAHIGFWGVTNLILGGLIMGLLFIQTRRVWAPFGFHFLWNFLQSTVLGFEVSGLDIYSLLQINEVGNVLFTGGDFGYEGSMVASIFLLGLTYYLFRTDPELTSVLFKPTTKQPVVAEKASAPLVTDNISKPAAGYTNYDEKHTTIPVEKQKLNTLKSRYETIVFDLGGVLIDWNPRYLYQDIFESKERMEWFLENIATSDWNEEQDAGRSLAEATELLVKQHPDWEDMIRLYYGAWEDMIGGTFPGTIKILRLLVDDPNYRVVALTNWSAETFPIALDRFEFLHWFEDILVSGQENLKKPDPAIYQLLIDKFGIDKSTALFIDDNARNVAVSNNFGLEAIQFTNSEDLKNKLIELGVLTTAVV